MPSRSHQASHLRTVEVRRMCDPDAPAVLSILEGSPEASMWSKESLICSAAEGTVWVAEVNGRVAGILIGRVAADEFEILNLAVDKSLRRQGIATRLVTAVLEYSKMAGARQTYLEVRASNDTGIVFYTRIGFRPYGRRAKYYRNPVEDAVLMALHENGIQQ